jgi:hypothetical protein
MECRRAIGFFHGRNRSTPEAEVRTPLKTLYILLFVGSLALNAAMAFFLVHPPVAASAATKAVSPTRRSAETLDDKVDAKIWSDLKTDDLPTLVARLRDSGFPPDVIRAIIVGQLNELYAARRKALGFDASSQAYWKNRRVDPKMQAALRELSREQEKALRDLLGPDLATAEPLNALLQSRQLRGLPPEKVGDVQQVIRSYDEKRAEIYSKTSSLGATDREKVAALDKDQRAAIAQLLTPAEFDNYQLYNSNTASQLRSQLSAFHPDEQEFRTIFALQNAFNEQFPNTYNNGPIFPGDQPAREAAQKQLTDQIQAALGPDRGADYTRANDYNYRQTDQLVARLQLPPETTNQIWAVQQDLQQRTQAIYSDRTLPPDQRAQQLATLADEAKTRISASLGEPGFEAYKQYGGQWMQRFQPPTPRPVR